MPLIHNYGNCLSSGLDLVQPSSPYIHAKHCCEVHYLKSTVLGRAHVISLTLLSGSSFLLHQARDICFPYPMISLSPSGHYVILHNPLVPFPDCQCMFSLIAQSQVLKESSAKTKKAMAITFLLLNSFEGTQKIKCSNIQLPHAEILSFPICFPFVSPLPASTTPSTWQFCPVTTPPMGCRKAEKNYQQI